MNILFVCPDWFPGSAGLAQSCYELCKELEHKGHTVRVATASRADLDSKDLAVIAIPCAVRVLRNPLCYRVYKTLKPHLQWADRVCLFSYMYELNARIVLLKKIGLYNKPLIHFYRGSLEPEVLTHLSQLTRLGKYVYDRTLARLLFSHVNAVISNSKNTLALIHKQYNTKRDTLHYVPNSVHLNDYTQSTLNNKRILFVGRLIDNKGIKYFPDILKVIPSDWTFTIVDDGPLRQYVENLKAEYPNMEILGKIPHKRLRQIYAQSDILVLPTLAEGSPRAVMEASASGVPSIAFNVGDVAQTIPPKTGWAIPCFGIALFTKRLDELIRNGRKRTEYGKNALQHAHAYMDAKINSEKIEAILLRTDTP